MDKDIKTLDDLKQAIRMLETDQAIKEQQLKAQFFISVESFKPINILKNSIKDVASSPYLIENVFGALLGITTGYISKKIIIGGSANKFKKLLGTMLQFGVANVVANQAHVLKQIGELTFSHFADRKKKSLISGKTNAANGI